MIPRLVYMASVSRDKSDRGFLNHSLAYFNTVDFANGTAPIYSAFENVTTCRYAEYRNPPDHPDLPYKRPGIYWHILAARLAFVVIFQVLTIILDNLDENFVLNVFQFLFFSSESRGSFYVTNPMALVRDADKFEESNEEGGLFDRRNGDKTRVFKSKGGEGQNRTSGRLPEETQNCLVLGLTRLNYYTNTLT